MRRLFIMMICTALMLCVSCSPAAGPGTSDTEPAPSEKTMTAYEMLSEIAENSRKTGGISYTETLSFSYPALLISMDLSVNRVQCSWDGTKADRYREACGLPGTRLCYISSAEDAGPFTTAMDLPGSGTEIAGTVIYVSGGVLSVVMNGEGKAVSGKADFTADPGLLADLLESADREESFGFVHDPADILDECVSLGDGIIEMLKNTDAVFDDDGSATCGILIPGTLIPEGRIDVSRLAVELEEGFALELIDMALNFRMTADGYLAEKTEKTRFSMNLLGNKFSELVVTARISYDSPGSKPDVSVPDIPDLEEYSPEELISMIAPQP